jgi:hypothetical protein
VPAGAVTPWGTAAIVALIKSHRPGAVDGSGSLRHDDVEALGFCRQRQAIVGSDKRSAFGPVSNLNQRSASLYCQIMEHGKSGGKALGAAQRVCS